MGDEGQREFDVNLADKSYPRNMLKTASVSSSLLQIPLEATDNFRKAYLDVITIR